MCDENILMNVPSEIIQNEGALSSYHSNQINLFDEEQHERESHFCHLCKKSYTKEENLLAHTALDHEVICYEYYLPKQTLTGYSCKKCHRSFDDYRSYEKHFEEKHFLEDGCRVLITESYDKMLQSGTSLEKLKSYFIYEINLQSDLGSIYTITAACLTEQTGPSAYKKQSPYQCDICLRLFKLKRGYESHMYYHREKKYSCQQCKRYFSSNDEFKVHECGSEKYHCKLCNKEVNSYMSLQTHLDKFHNKDKSFLCNICSQTFATRKSLRQHKTRFHKQKDTFICRNCSKSFNIRRNLEIHLRSKKASTCDSCNTTFCSRKLFLQHSKVLKKRLKCNICCEEFSTQCVLDSHYLTSQKCRLRKTE